MAKIKYYYDTESCRYERIKVSRTDILLNLLGFLTLSILLAIGIVAAYFHYFESPKEAYLKKENDELRLHYSTLESELKSVSSMLAALQERDDNVYRRMFGVEPVSTSIREAGTGGVDRYRELQGLSQEELFKRNYALVDKLKRQMYIQTKSYDFLVDLSKRKEELLASMPAIQPVSNRDLKALTSGFGWRTDPFLRVLRMHTGVDYTVPMNTPIYATGDGVVSKVEVNFGGYGKMIDIDHGFGFKTKYAHMNKFVVKQGQKVKRGELLGYSGNTGRSTGPHLHYEVIVNGEKVNPINYMYQDLSADQYAEILRLASIENIAVDSY
jgi:murein DD-endopeptidase MepM/ murein hydrolase activator NlpD